MLFYQYTPFECSSFLKMWRYNWLFRRVEGYYSYIGGRKKRQIDVEILSVMESGGGFVICPFKWPESDYEFIFCR